MNKVQKAKLAVEIDRLRTEAKQLNDKAADDERMHAAAWETHGSELAGPPQSITINKNTAKELLKKAEFLSSALRGEQFVEEILSLEASVIMIDKQISDLFNQKGRTFLRITSLKYLKSIISPAD